MDDVYRLTICQNANRGQWRYIYRDGQIGCRPYAKRSGSLKMSRHFERLTFENVRFLLLCLGTNVDKQELLMKYHSLSVKRSIIIVWALLLIVCLANAQNVGDLRTNGKHTKVSNKNNWQIYDGRDWVIPADRRLCTEL